MFQAITNKYKKLIKLYYEQCLTTTIKVNVSQTTLSCATKKLRVRPPDKWITRQWQFVQGTFHWSLIVLSECVGFFSVPLAVRLLKATNPPKNLNRKLNWIVTFWLREGQAPDRFALRKCKLIFHLFIVKDQKQCFLYPLGNLLYSSISFDASCFCNHQSVPFSLYLFLDLFWFV